MGRRQGKWLLVLATAACGGRESGDGGGVPDGSGSGEASVATDVLAICDHYFAASQIVQSPRVRFTALGERAGCNGIVLPESETARIRARFEQVCLNEMALPGSGMTPATLEACASAIDSSPCEVQPVECTFFGTLPGGAA